MENTTEKWNIHQPTYDTTFSQLAIKMIRKGKLGNITIIEKGHLSEMSFSDDLFIVLLFLSCLDQ